MDSDIQEDDRSPELSLSVDPEEISEDRGESTVTVSTGTAFADAQTITLAIDSNSTATETDDYTVSSKSLTLGAGESSVTATVTAVHDTYDEEDESILVIGTHNNLEVGRQRITITDDDELALTVELSDAVIAESGGTSTVTVKTDDVTFADDQTITLVLGGTATETDDYTVTKELTLDAGESSVTTTVTAVQDTYDDDGETIEIKARHGVGTESEVQRITITDDDELALTVELSDAEIAESGGTSTVTVKTDDVTFADDQTITLVLGGTATETDDYTVTKELTLDAGESSVTTTVTAVHDTYDDDGETIEIKARHGVGTESEVQRITITDDDELALTVELSDAEIVEAGGTSTVTVKTDDVTFADDQTITLVLGGTATETDDYTVTKELTLDAGESSVTTTVTAVHDTYDDDGETIEIKARHGVGTESEVQRITITDDDELALTVELSDAEIAESGGTSTVTVKTDDVTFADDQTITLVLGGTATETDDYTVTKELTLDAGESSVTTTVTAVHDTYDDDGETIEIKARHGAGTESEVQRITITDDDELALTVELSDAVIAESGGTSTVTVKTDDVTFADDQTITLVLGGTATETDDYTVTKELTLDAGESSVTTTVTAVHDTYDDDGETIEIKARHGAGTESEVQRITITDDDELALTVELSDAEIAESGGTSTVTVKTDDVTFADDQTITLVLGGTATESDDYTVTKELTLDAGESSVTTTVTAVQDTYDDDGETIEIKARHGAGTESEVQRITITDDDELALTVELSDAEIVEAGGTSTVTVKTDDVTFADDQTITLVLGGTATETDDYTVTKELTLDAGESSVTTTVTAVHDTYDDDGETIEIKARHGVGTESEVQRITITDDDELALTVELSDAVIAESGGTSTVTVKTDDVTFADDQTITLVLGGTATETDDYTVTKELTLDAGESSVTTTVTAVHDTYDDDGETIEIKARHGVGTESEVQRITITDDDELALTVELSDAVIAESGGTSTVTVKTDDVTFADDQTITLVLGGTATETDDYTVTKELTLDAGESSVTTTVTAVHDTYDDDGETIEIKARHGAGTESEVQRITITDDDELALTVELSDAEIAESGGTSTVTVKTDDVTFADDQTITLVLGGTATETDDYTVTKELTLDAGESSVTTTVTAVHDTYDDDGETIEIKARHGAGTESEVQRITITDDDELALTVELSDAVIAESGGTSTVTVKTDDVTFADDQTITLVLGGTATETDDYTVTKELTLDAGESSVTTTVTAVHDTYDDDGETIEIKARHGVGTESEVQRITITDDDELALTVELSDAVIAESGGTSTVTVKTDDVTFADDQTITLVLGGTATETDDYTVTKELTLDAGESSVTTTVTAVQDTYDDDGETIEIKARHGVGTESEVQRITITDDDELALTVELSDAEIAESGGTSTVTVKTDDVTFADDQTITLVLGGTATETDDYTVTKELTLDAGESSVTTTVTAVQDTYDDDGETIEIKARHGVGTESEVQRITITDDDELALTVELSDAEIAESGGTSTVTVKTDDVTFADDQTITLMLGGTATETDDYTVTTELTLDAGESSVTTTVTAVQDTYDDDGETIEIKARHGVSTESEVQRITITDDDELALTVELSDAVIAESGGTSTVTVKTDDVTFADDQTITLVLGGTATETDDYTVTKELTLDAGESSVTTTVTAVHDTLAEGTELIAVSAKHGADTESEVQRITITDNDFVTVSVKAVTVEDDPGTLDVDEKDDKSVVEEGETAMFAVELSGAVASEVKVSYATGDEDDTATAGTGNDYTAARGILTFAAKEISRTVSVATLEDGSAEGAEKFTLKIAAPDPAVAGVSLGTSSTTGTITDTDSLTVSVTANPTNVNEGETATFTVALLGGKSSADVVVMYELGGTATIGADYDAPAGYGESQGTVTIGPDETQSTVTIKTLEDILVESSPHTVEITLTSVSSAGDVTLATTSAEITIENTTTAGLTITPKNPVPTQQSSAIERSSATARSGAVERISTAQRKSATAQQAEQATNADMCYCVIEAGSLELEVKLGSVSGDEAIELEVGATVVVPYRTSDRDSNYPSDRKALAGVDYVTASGSLTFEHNALVKTITLHSKHDTLVEETETFLLELDSAPLPDGNNSTDAVKVEVEIHDDDTLSATDSGPTVTLRSPGSFPATGTFTVNIDFSADVTGLKSTDITVTNDTHLDFGGSGKTYTLRITPKEEFDGHVTVTVPADAAQDGNTPPRGNIAGSKSFSVDTTTAPTVTIESWDDFPAHGAFDVTIKFSESVSDFALDDIEVANGSPGNFTGTGATYSVEITPVDGFSGYVIVTVPAGAAVDDVGNRNHPRSRRFPVNMGAPTVTIESWDDFPAHGAFDVTIKFSESVSGFTLDDIVVTNGSPGNFAGTSTTYTVEITPDVDFAGDVIVTVPAHAAFDADGNGNKRGSEEFKVDTTLVQVDVSFGAAAYTALEDGSPATITVLLSADPERTVVIPITVRNGNGASDDDYSGVPEQVRFTSGQTSRTFTVTATSDIDEDAGETVTLGFGALPAAVNAGTPANATITLAGESSKTRYARVMRALLPRAAAAMSDATVGAIGNRIDSVGSGFGSDGSLSLAGVQMLTRVSAAEGSPDNIYWTSRDETRNMSSAQLLRGSSFVMTLDDRARLAGRAPADNPGAAAVWGSGDYRNLGGSENALAWRGNLVSLHLGADVVALPELVAGIAVARSLVGFDYTDRTNPRTVTGTFETDLLSVHPYASWTPSFGLGFWATGGLGWGAVGIDDSLDERRTSTTRLLTGALGGSSRLLSVDGLVPGGATALRLKGEGFVTRAMSEETGPLVAQDVGVQRVRLSVEGSHEQRGLWGSVLKPALELGLRHDSGDAAKGAGLELGGELRYVQPELGLTVEGRGRVLTTHRSVTEEWGIGGKIQLDLGSGRQGLSLSLAPSLGVAASGTHALWQQGVVPGSTLGLPGTSGSQAASRLDAQADFGMLTMGGQGLLTPYGGFSLAGRDGRDYRAGARLETDTFNLSLEGIRSERGSGPADHGVTVQGAVRF